MWRSLSSSLWFSNKVLYAKVKGLVKGALSVAGERNVLESFLGTVEQQISAQGVREESQGDV